MRNLVAHAIRRLHRKVDLAERRLALVDLTGKVKAGSQDMDKRTVRLMLGKTAQGEDILSAPVRWDASGAGTFKMHAAPKDGEQMALHSPSGTVGPTSLARWGTYDKDNAPPSKDKDEAVLEFGGEDGARISFKKDEMTFAVGGKDAAVISIKKDAIKPTVGGSSGFEIKSDALQMVGKFKAKGGSRPAHYKGGKDDAGDTAIDGNDDMLV